MFRNPHTRLSIVSSALLLVASLLMGSAFAQGEPVEGGEIEVALNAQGIRGLRTWQDNTANETHIYTIVYDTFVRYDEAYNIVGGLFDSWETDDATTWTFHVRDGVTWHDGVELTAQHFIDYFDAVQDPERGATTETISLFDGVSYEAVDDDTVRMVLPEPNAALLDAFSRQWLSRVEDYDSASPVGTGPFELVEWRRNEVMRFEASDAYWRDGLPYLDGLTIRMVPDATTRLNMLLTDEVDLIRSVPMAELERLEGNDDVQLVKTPDQYSISHWYLLFHNPEPALSDVRVRRAINLAIDRETLLQVTFGRGTIRSSAVAEGSWAFNPDARSYNERDVEAAQELMREAGYDPTAMDLQLTLKYWEEWPENPQIAQIIQANLAEIGIQVTLELLEIGQWVDTVAYELDFELALTALVPSWDPDDQLGNTYQIDDGAALEWENQAFTDAWIAGRATADIEERREAYFEAQRIAMEEVPSAVLNGVPAFDAATSDLHNVIRYNRGDIFYERMWLDR
jgi:peptide/nickel transport system substrate-binding protein